jgi:hypothetical protein
VDFNCFRLRLRNATTTLTQGVVELGIDNEIMQAEPHSSALRAAL